MMSMISFNNRFTSAIEVAVLIFFRAKDHEIASYDTEQIVDVPGAEDIQAEGKQRTFTQNITSYLANGTVLLIPQKCL